LFWQNPSTEINSRFSVFWDDIPWCLVIFAGDFFLNNTQKKLVCKEKTENKRLFIWQYCIKHQKNSDNCFKPGISILTHYRFAEKRPKVFEQ